MKWLMTSGTEVYYGADFALTVVGMNHWCRDYFT